MDVNISIFKGCLTFCFAPVNRARSPVNVLGQYRGTDQAKPPRLYTLGFQFCYGSNISHKILHYEPAIIYHFHVRVISICYCIFSLEWHHSMTHIARLTLGPTGGCSITVSRDQEDSSTSTSSIPSFSLSSLFAIN